MDMVCNGFTPMVGDCTRFGPSPVVSPFMMMIF